MIVKILFSAHSITSDVSLAETAQAAEFFLADGLIVTGNATGDAAKLSDFEGYSIEFNLLQYTSQTIYKYWGGSLRTIVIR